MHADLQAAFGLTDEEVHRGLFHSSELSWKEMSERCAARLAACSAEQRERLLVLAQTPDTLHGFARNILGYAFEQTGQKHVVPIAAEGIDSALEALIAAGVPPSRNAFTGFPPRIS